MAPVKLLNKTYQAVRGMNKATLMPNVKSLNHWEAAMTKGYRGSGATRVPAKGFKQDELVGRTARNASPSTSSGLEREISKHERRIDNVDARGGDRISATTYGGTQPRKSASGSFSGGPTVPVGPSGPGGGPMIPPKGPTPPIGRSYGPAHNIPEHANPNGAHSVISEVGRGGRLWGNSMHNFEQAGGMARLGTSAVRGAMVGGISGGLFEGATGGDFWEGAKSGAMYGAVGAGARRGMRSLSGAKQGQGTFSAVNKHLNNHYREGWSNAAFNTVRLTNATKVNEKVMKNGNKI